jgi:hypothetical protein
MKLRYKYSKLYWFLKGFEFLKVYFSPFKFFLPKLYIGKTAIGVPIFYPRTFVKATPQRAIDAAVKEMRATRNFNKNNPNYPRKEKSFRELYDEKMKYTYAVPLKVGFSSCGLGWKTKWTSTDYIFEHQPIWSLVFFGYQIALIFNVIEPYHYWTCFLYYTRNTDKNKTVEERIKQAREGFPCTWRNYSDGETTLICYWDLILKNRYL